MTIWSCFDDIEFLVDGKWLVLKWLVVDDEREMERGGRAKYLWAGRGAACRWINLLRKFSAFLERARQAGIERRNIKKSKGKCCVCTAAPSNSIRELLPKPDVIRS